MKQNTNRNSSAFTLVEVIVMIVIIALLALFYLPTVTTRSRVPLRRISCMNNLKQIGIAYRIWANDNGDLWPSQQTISNGGWAEMLANANQGPNCWTNYAIMQNELGQSTKIVICPSDERQPASSFTNQFNNLNVSYFVGVSANDLYPQSIAGGDRNLGPGLISSNDYGYSPKTGKGNDVAIPTNSAKYPVSWSLKMHSAGNPVGPATSSSATAAANRSPPPLSTAYGCPMPTPPPTGPPATSPPPPPSASFSPDFPLTIPALSSTILIVW